MSHTPADRAFWFCVAVATAVILRKVVKHPKTQEALRNFRKKDGELAHTVPVQTNAKPKPKESSADIDLDEVADEKKWAVLRQRQLASPPALKRVKSVVLISGEQIKSKEEELAAQREELLLRLDTASIDMSRRHRQQLLDAAVAAGLEKHPLYAKLHSIQWGKKTRPSVAVEGGEVKSSASVGTRRIHAVLVEDLLARDGAQEWLLSTARHLKDAGHEVTVIAPRESFVANQTKKDGIALCEYVFDRVNLPLEIAKNQAKMTKVLRSANVVVCLVRPKRGSFQNVVFLGDCIQEAGLDVHFIAKTGDRYSDPSFQRSYYVHPSRADPSVSSVLTSTQNTSKRICDRFQIPKELVTTIYNGISVDRFTRRAGVRQAALTEYAVPAGASPVLGGLGPFTTDREHVLLIEAVPLIQRKWPNVHVVLIGQGPTEAALRARIKELGVEQHVSLFPHTTTPEHLYEVVDVTVVPAIAHGTPRVALESMAMGVPTAACNMNSLPEVCIEGQTGALFERGDAQGLADAVDRLWRDQDRYKQLAEGGKALVRAEHDLDRQFEKFLNYVVTKGTKLRFIPRDRTGSKAPSSFLQRRTRTESAGEDSDAPADSLDAALVRNEVARTQGKVRTPSDSLGSSLAAAEQLRDPTCCPPTRCPALVNPAEYKAKGRTLVLGGNLRLYVTGRKSEAGIIVVPDVFGLDSGRHKGIADQLADNGYYVVMPDFFHGDALTFKDLFTPRMDEFIKAHPPHAFQEDFELVYTHLADVGVHGTGMMGFCWGAWAIFRESARGSPFSCGVNFHPSLIIEQLFFNGTIDALAAKARHPMLMSPCQDDPAELQPNGSVDKLLRAKPFGADCAWLPFPEQNHGFVSQGDLSQEAVRRDVGIALDQAVAFFKEHLRKEPQRPVEAANEQEPAGAHVVATLQLPKHLLPKLKREQERIEGSCGVQLTIEETEDKLVVAIAGAKQAVEKAQAGLNELVLDVIRFEMGQDLAEEEPEYLKFFTGGNVKALAQIFEQYPEIVAIKKRFDSANLRGDNRLDREEFSQSFTSLLPSLCGREHSAAYERWVFDSIGEHKGESINWKEFITFCLRNRLIILQKEPAMPAHK